MKKALFDYLSDLKYQLKDTFMPFVFHFKKLPISLMNNKNNV